MESLFMNPEQIWNFIDSNSETGLEKKIEYWKVYEVCCE